MCTPATAAAKAPAEGCPLPCGTRARAEPSRRPAGADPPQPRLLWGTDRTVAPCRGAGLGLPRTKCPEEQPDGPKAPREEGAEAQGPAEPERGSGSPTPSPGRRPLLRVSAGPRGQAALGTGRRRHLPGGDGDCAGPGLAAPPQPRARRARGRDRRQQRHSRGAAAAAGRVVPRTQVDSVNRRQEGMAALPPSNRPGGRLSSQAVAWPSGLRRWI